MSKKILITGASSGFGELSALKLIDQGHTVVASMRGIEGKNKANAEKLKKAGAHIVEIDVTDDKSVNQGVEAAIREVGGLDVVINNAGVGVLGLQETFTAEDWKALFDINVFGVQRVNRAVLPHMREKQAGLIIYVTSLLGRMVMPFYGPYNATKWAMEALAENYRVELSGFGIQSCIVEPGGYSTSFMDKLIKPGDTSRDAGYGDFVHMPMQMFEGFEQALSSNPAQDPQDVAEAISNLIDTTPGERPFRTVVDKMGMGDPIDALNEQQEQVTAGVFSAFGMGEMLKLKE
jgi:NAD(P)-dependent dehydrogenase (short-subunit alcohol dehydrogenase family)